MDVTVTDTEYFFDIFIQESQMRYVHRRELWRLGFLVNEGITM